MAESSELELSWCGVERTHSAGPGRGGGKTQLRSCRSKEVIRVLGRRVKGAFVCSSSSPAVQNCSGDLHV